MIASDKMMLNRREGSRMKFVFAALVLLLLIIGLYSYDVRNRLFRAEDRAERLRQQQDSVSAQLQVVYEHKSRLEKSLQLEKGEHKKSRDELSTNIKNKELKYQREKQELLKSYETLQQQHKMLKNTHDDLLTEFGKLQQQHLKSVEDNQKVQSQHQSEYQQMKQEKDNEIATLKDNLANCERQKSGLRKDLTNTNEDLKKNENKLSQFNKKEDSNLAGGKFDADKEHNDVQRMHRSGFKRVQNAEGGENAHLKDNKFNKDSEVNKNLNDDNFNDKKNLQDGGAGNKNAAQNERHIGGAADVGNGGDSAKNENLRPNNGDNNVHAADKENPQDGQRKQMNPPPAKAQESNADENVFRKRAADDGQKYNRFVVQKSEKEKEVVLDKPMNAHFPQPDVGQIPNPAAHPKIDKRSVEEEEEKDNGRMEIQVDTKKGENNDQLHIPIKNQNGQSEEQYPDQGEDQDDPAAPGAKDEKEYDG